MQTVNTWRENPVAVQPRDNHRLYDREMKLREKLLDWRKKVGVKEKIPSNAVISRDLVELLDHHDPQSKEELAQVMQNYPHRLQKYGDRLFQIVKRNNQ